MIVSSAPGAAHSMVMLTWHGNSFLCHFYSHLGKRYTENFLLVIMLCFSVVVTYRPPMEGIGMTSNVY